MTRDPSSTSDRKVYIRTFGCQMNVYDTGKMKAQLARDGYAQTEVLDEADLGRRLQHPGLAMKCRTGNAAWW